MNPTKEAVEKELNGLANAYSELSSEVKALRAKCEALQAFKDYVHKRLDDAGVPVDPESPHKAEGCRIGGRLDCVLAIAAALEQQGREVEFYKGRIEEMRLAYNEALQKLPRGVMSMMPQFLSQDEADRLKRIIATAALTPEVNDGTN